MAIKLKKQASGSVVRPPASHVAFFIDQNGNPSTMDSEGVIAPAVSVDGSPLSLTVQGSAPEDEALKVKLYSKSVSGTAEFFVIDDQGNEVQITSGGSVVGGAPHINWKNDTPGTPYGAGDTVTAAFGDVIMINVEDPDTCTVNFPAITPASAGRRVDIRSLADKKKGTPGLILFVPDPADSFENHPTGQSTAGNLSPEFRTHMTFESDGVGRWNFIGWGAPLTLGAEG